jgi:hypothetical protein
MRNVRTWSGVIAIVQEEHQREGARPNAVLYLTLGDECLSEVALLTGLPRRVWTNAASVDGGTLTVSGNAVALPAECRKVTRVEWDGDDKPLRFRSEETLDFESPGWRSATGEPTAYTIVGGELFLDTNPTGTLTGKLVVRGQGSFDPLSEDSSDPNPLADLPVDYGMMLAHYILAFLPVADDESMRPISERRQAKHEALWLRARSGLVAVANQRSRLAFKY